MNNLFGSILAVEEVASSISISSFIICTLVSLVLGFVIAKIYTYKNTYSKSFVVTLALLPAIVQLVIMLVNGSIGTGIAAMGAFSLVRFRSLPGTAKEICSIFWAMTIGLATGIGYIMFAVLFTLILGSAYLMYEVSDFGVSKSGEKDLKITIPEDLYTAGVFNDLFDRYTSQCQLVQVKTSNMGSMFKLHYRIQLNDESVEKSLIDELRCRNGNLEISCGVLTKNREEL